MVASGIDFNSPAIRAFCRKWKVRELSVFGSVLRDDFRPDSDVDFLLAFENDARPTLAESVQMEAELSALVKRPVDVVLQSEISGPDANPYRSADILRNRRAIHGPR
ncbi:MAG TPA: nucleotidyltransferase domain-containing protein [Chthonomonadaceae bacterium]|nr:nucleotidyltransferase domain-containing protein [Chthonomonadaceae bacterium]